MDLREWQAEGYLDITQGRAVFDFFFLEPRVRLAEELGLESPGVGNRETKRHNECDILVI
jgi:hypothetical protein